jgi:hypothetical protein
VGHFEISAGQWVNLNGHTLRTVAANDEPSGVLTNYMRSNAEAAKYLGLLALVAVVIIAAALLLWLA